MPETIATCYSRVNSILLIPGNSSALFNRCMDVYEIRRANLAYFVALLGNAEKVADRVSRVSHTPVTHIRNMKNGVRNMGPEIARRFEVAFEKDRGWMDRDHGFDLEREALVVARAWSALDPDDRADVIRRIIDAKRIVTTNYDALIEQLGAEQERKESPDTTSPSVTLVQSAPAKSPEISRRLRKPIAHKKRAAK